MHQKLICNEDEVFPLRKEIDTHLEKENYSYLKRFLDVTKSNLFFAKGIIIVEGWAEEILIPTIAERLGYDLTKHEVSIVNVGSTAYLHFAKIFLRKDGKKMNIPVSVVTDLDVRPDENGIFDTIVESTKRTSIENNFQDFNGSDIKLEIAKQWTLEWCLFKSSFLTDSFKEAVAYVHSKTEEFKKDENDAFKPDFQKKLIHKLSKKEGTSQLDKVAVANSLAEKIAENKPALDENDEYLKYLADAIKHACRM